MGGCRCSYRNCTAKSDGKTHLFHYPVFDRVRCHQWLVNADRLDLMNLTVSQLKNRVVCQHHFKDECFMNYIKDKLRYDAVPTEDGPYCDNFDWVSSKLEKDEDNSKLYSISVEDLENVNSHEKESNVSKKYVDFLTNGELSDLDCINQPNEETVINLKDSGINLDNIPGLKTNKEIPGKTTMIDIELLPLNTQTPQKNYKSRLINTQILEKESKISKSPKVTQRKKIKIISEKKLSDPVRLEGELKPISPSFVLQQPKKKKRVECDKSSDNTNQSNNTNTLINILNNSTVDEFKPQVIELEYPENVNYIKVSNSGNSLNTQDNESLLNLRNEHSTLVNILNNSFPTMEMENTHGEQGRISELGNINKDPTNQHLDVNANSFVSILDNGNLEHFKESMNIEGEKLNQEFVPKISYATSNKNCSNQKRRINLQSSPSLFIKNKISPERIAAIEEKRKFNMKLRDIIEAGLSKLNEDDVKKPETSKLSNTNNQIISAYLSKDKNLPSHQEYSFASLESRIKRMEDTLLSKIEQNTSRIIDLKKKFTSGQNTKTTVSTQTSLEDEVLKKYLFHEISNFLSPETNSLIYEELFLNKFAFDAEKKTRSPKKRKRR